MKTSADYMREWRKNNSAKNKENDLRHKRKKKEWLAEIKTILTCEKCGESRHWVLDFHHTNPKEKEVRMTHLRYWSRERILKEIAKCIVLCANCHRDEHYQILNGENDESHS